MRELAPLLRRTAEAAHPLRRLIRQARLAASQASGQTEAPAPTPPTMVGTEIITSKAMDAEGIAVRRWPGDERYARAAFYAYAHSARTEFADAKRSRLSPATGILRSANMSSTGTTS